MIDYQVATYMSYQPMETYKNSQTGEDQVGISWLMGRMETSVLVDEIIIAILATLEVDEVSSNNDLNDSDEGSSNATKAISKQ